MKMRTMTAFAVVLFASSAALAQTIQDTANFTNIDHAAGIGDPDNSIEIVTSTAAAPYRLFNLNWEGTVSPIVSTTWGNELRLHITHDQSGREAFLLLAPGDAQTYPNNTMYSGASSSLGGIEVNPGDTFTMEFWDSFDDGAGVDARWSVLDFEFEDIDITATPAVAPGHIRIDTQGSNQFPTTPGSDGERFWGVTYGADTGGLPDIASIEIDLGADPRAGFFNPNLPDGEFVVSESNGFSSTFTDTYSNPDEDFFEHYASMSLDINSENLGPGDSMRFGVEIFGLGALGFQMRDNDPQPMITVHFDNGTSVSGSLSEFGLDGVSDLFMSYIDLDVSAAAGNGEGNVPEPSSIALLGLFLVGLTALIRRRGNKSMKTLLLAFSVSLVFASGAVAGDLLTLNQTFVFNEDVQGGANNVFSQFAGSSFTIGDVNWTGAAALFADDDGAFPSFAGDMHVRITHTRQSNGVQTFHDMMLADGANWTGERSFTGTSPHMRGWQVDAGDELSFEFFEGYKDLEFADSVWNSIGISLTDNNNTAPAATGAIPDGHVRVRALGQNTFPVTARNPDGSPAADSRGDGATYWQIIYGPDASGTLPKITGAKFDLGDPSVMSFDRSALEGEPSVFFTNGDPNAPSGLSLQFSNPDPDFGGAFGAMEFLFDPNSGTQDFLPGGLVAIGWDMDGGPFDGVDLADLATPIQLTLTFSDGSTSTAELDTRGYQGLFDVSDGGDGSLLTGMQYGYHDIPVIQASFDEADFDEDGDVDGDDFLAWQGGFGLTSGATKMDGDYDNDGDVDGDDFLGWQSEFGNGGASASPNGATDPIKILRAESFLKLEAGLFGNGGLGSGAVPEPASIVLVVIGLVALVGYRRR